MATMDKILRVMLQLPAYAAFAAVLGYLSLWPRYDYASPRRATVKISISHATSHVKPCVRLTPAEIAALPPNMRRPEQCERKRLPLIMELAIDGTVMLQREAQPSGLWGDGPASVYERFEAQPGQHRITARLRDTARTTGWDYTHTQDVNLRAGRYFTVTFKAETGGFVFR